MKNELYKNFHCGFTFEGETFLLGSFLERFRPNSNWITSRPSNAGLFLCAKNVRNEKRAVKTTKDDIKGDKTPTKNIPFEEGGATLVFCKNETLYVRFRGSKSLFGRVFERPLEPNLHIESKNYRKRDTIRFVPFCTFQYRKPIFESKSKSLLICSSFDWSWLV